MKTTRIVLALLALALFSFPITAEEQTSTLEGTAEIAVQDVSNSNDNESAKFYEYRDLPDGMLFHLFDLRLNSEKYLFTIRAEHPGESDERYDLTLRKYGQFKLDYRFDRIPHNFSFNAVTPYTEVSPGVWTLPDELQDQTQSILGDNGSNLPEAMDILSDYLANAHPTSLSLQRKRQEVDFSYDFSDPLRISMNFQDEAKDGYRAIGAALGFGNVMELPETVDQRTQQGNISLSYFKKNVSIDFGIAPSHFENNILSMTWDNPYRLTDQMPPGDLTFLLGNGSGMGQMALAPDNTATKIFFNGSFRVLPNTRIFTSISYNQLTQDDKMLPYTINSGLTEEYAGALTAPQETADLESDITTARVALRSRLYAHLDLNAGYSYYDYDSKGTTRSMPGYAILDQNWVDEPQEVQFYDYTRERYFANLTWSVWENTSFEVGYRGLETDRDRGGSDAGSNTEDTYYLTLTTAPAGWISFRGTYSSSDRDWSRENGGNVIYPVRNDASFPFRRYYEAQRDREEVDLDLSLNPVDNLGISFLYKTDLNSYDESQYGLKSDDYRSFSADVNYTIGNQKFYGYYVWEENKGLQADRQTSFPPFDVISNDPLNDWTAMLQDTTNTYGLKAELTLVPNRWTLDASFSQSETEGESLLATPEGGRPDVAVNFDNDLDSTRFTLAKARLLYTVNDHLKIGLSEWYEKYNLDDILQDGVNVNMLKEGYAFYLGSLETNYEYFVSAFHLIYSW